MRHRLLISALLLTAAVQAPAQDGGTAPPSPLFTGADLFNLAYASDPQISPDGRTVAYVRMSGDVMVDRYSPAIWLVDVASGRQSMIAEGRSPRWSPDGRRIAFVAGATGSAPQIHVRWVDSGDTARITGLATAPLDMSWSPDGRRIAYTMTVVGEGASFGKAPPKPEGAQWAPPLEVIDKLNYRADGEGYVKPGFEHLFLVDADGGASRRLTNGAFNHSGPIEWSADGRQLFFSANRNSDWDRELGEADLYSLDLAAGTLRKLLDRKGFEGSPRPSPDGRSIAFLASPDDGQAYNGADLYLMDANGGNVRQLAVGLDRDIAAIRWGGSTLYAGYEERGSYKVARIAPGGQATPLSAALVAPALGRPYAGGAWSVARDGTLVFTSGSAARPADLSVLRGGSARQLTRLNDNFLSSKRLATVQELNATAPDGTAVPGWIMLPPGYREGTRVPLILEIHGGPYTSYGPDFSTDYQLYAAAGYAVLFPNMRGSTGYGEAFSDSIDKTYPAPNETDLNAHVDAAIAAGIADPDNLFVTGGSGGGLLTAWMVGKTDRFKAAVSQKPVINWTTFALTADNISFFGRYWLGKQPWQDNAGNWARSPLSLVDKVRTPTMVLVGGDDLRTPVSESEQYYSALRLAGVPTALVKVPGAPHGLDGRPSQAAARVSAILAWFDRYRKK